MTRNYASINFFFKITGPTGIFGENQDIKMFISEPFANNLALMLNE